MTHAIYEVNLVRDVTMTEHGLIIIQDRSERFGTLSVTNDIEWAVAELVQKHLPVMQNPGYVEPIEKFLVIYKDTEGIWDGIDIRDGKFYDWIKLQTKDFRKACYRVRHAVCLS